MASFLGIIGSILILTNFFMFSARRINRKFFNNKNAFLTKASASLRAPHPFVGITALLLGLAHGFMMVGSLPLHSGTLICAVLAVMGLTALLGRKIKLRNWFKAHRLESACLALLLVFHFLTTKGFIGF